MESSHCKTCGQLLPSPARSSWKRCSSCLLKRRLAKLRADSYISKTFCLLWTKRLYRELGMFLETHEVPLETQYRMLPKAAHIFREAEKTFGRPGEMSEEWIGEMIEQAGRKFHPTFFRTFLVNEHFLSAPDQDEQRLQALLAKVEQFPPGYQRLMEVYLNEPMAFRARQIKQHARKPLAVRTIRANFTLYTKLIRWLTEQMPELTGWEMVQEEHIHIFLLTLPPISR